MLQQPKNWLERRLAFAHKGIACQLSHILVFALQVGDEISNILLSGQGGGQEKQ